MQTGFKKPITDENVHEFLNFMNFPEKYIKNLYTIEEKIDRRRNEEIMIRVQLISSQRKSGFIGFWSVFVVCLSVFIFFCIKHI